MLLLIYFIYTWRWLEKHTKNIYCRNQCLHVSKSLCFSVSVFIQHSWSFCPYKEFPFLSENALQLRVWTKHTLHGVFSAPRCSTRLILGFEWKINSCTDNPITLRQFKSISIYTGFWKPLCEHSWPKKCGWRIYVILKVCVCVWGGGGVPRVICPWYTLTGHLIRFIFASTGLAPFCLQNCLNYFLDSTRCWKHSSEMLVYIDTIASHSCCRFVGCTSMMQITRSTTSQMCSIGLRSSDCGGHLSKVNSLSCSRNQSVMIWALWHYPAGSSHQKMVHCCQTWSATIGCGLWRLNDAQFIL